MSPLTRINQFNQYRSPETVQLGDEAIEMKVLLPDGEAVTDAQKILEDPVKVPLLPNQGFDDDNAQKEHAQGVEETVEDAVGVLEREAAVGHRVLVTGHLAQYLVDKAAILAEQPTSEAQIAAIKFTTRYEASQEPTKETDPFEHLSEAARLAIQANRDRYELEPAEIVGVEMEPKDELEAHRRLATAKHVAKLVEDSREAAAADTVPEPIWVDQHGFELGEGEYFKSNNFEESTAVFKALDRYLHATGRQDEIQDFYDETFENQSLLELKGEKAQDVRNALRMVAEQPIEEAQEATKEQFKLYGTRVVPKDDLEADKKIAQRMLAIREQGPKAIERVEIAPDDEVIRTGEVYDIRRQERRTNTELSVSNDDLRLAA